MGAAIQNMQGETETLINSPASFQQSKCLITWTVQVKLPVTVSLTGSKPDVSR